MRAKIAGEKHFTASVLLITKTKPQKILLLHHVKLNSWLQPGGHIEPLEHPIESAIREVQEETGIDISFLHDAILNDNEGTLYLPLPQFFLQETIPARKDEPKHFHLDLMYVVPVEEKALTRNMRESHDIGWFTKKEALKLSLFANTRKVIEDLLDEV